MTYRDLIVQLLTRYGGHLNDAVKIMDCYDEPLVFSNPGLAYCEDNVRNEEGDLTAAKGVLLICL